jgi:cardiolipin synthase C
LGKKNKLKFSFFLFLCLIFFVYIVTSIGLMVFSRWGENSVTHTNATEAVSYEKNSIRMIDNGLASLYERLQLIENAKKSIELEFFIFDIDQASRLITQALVERARNGVKVRISVDFSAPVFQLQPIYAGFMKKHGIEVRYYNTAAIYRIVSSQHRSHRKFLIVDGDKLITGGRNIANDYFDLGENYNFLDADIDVRGPVVQNALASFDLYWNSDMTISSDKFIGSQDETDIKKARSFFELNENDESTLKRIKTEGAITYERNIEHVCADLTFITDSPGRNEASRKVFNAITQILSEAKTEVYAESPYFILRKGGLEVVKNPQTRNVKLTVLTNSLYSTDASYAVAALYRRLGDIAETGLSLYAFHGDAVAGQSSHLDGRWGIHAKRAVIDDETVMVGTYNLDPRSANLNSELAFVCRGNKDFAADIKSSIEARIKQADLITRGGQIEANNSILKRVDTWSLIKFFILVPIADLFDFLL